MKNRFIDNAIFIMLIVVLLFLISYIVVLLYPFKVAEFHSPLKVLTPIVQKGGSLLYQQDSEKFMQIEGNMNCYYVDGLTLPVGSKPSNRAVGINKEVISIVIPESLPPATYFYKCTLTYEVLGIKEVRYEFYTDNFTVTK